MQKHKQKKQRHPYHHVLQAISAGQKAFLIGTDPANNPYSGDARKAWDKGFFDEMNVVEFVRPEHGAREQARRKYANPDHRLPYGDSLPDKPFRRFERFSYAEASVSQNRGRDRRD